MDGDKMAGKIRYLLERNGSFFARVIVPKDLRLIVGKTELLKALGSHRPEALRSLHGAVAEFQAILNAARRQLAASSPAQKQAYWRSSSFRDLAREHYEAELRQDEFARFVDIPGVVGPHEFNRLFANGYLQALRKLVGGFYTQEEADEGFIEATIGPAIDRLNVDGKTTVRRGTPEWLALANVLAAIQIEAIERSKERDDGDFHGKPKHPLLNDEACNIEINSEPVSIMGLLQGYLKELAGSGKGVEARKRWTPCFRDFVAFLGHDDARKITKTDVVRWKDSLLETRSPKTVRDSNIGSLRAVFQWAADNLHIGDNPAAGIKVRVTAKTLNREKGFTHAEALAILSAARAYEPKHSDNPQTRERAPLIAAKRWVPWLCAHTGARVAEITQLRKEDVRAQDGISFIRITPEAGSVKTGRYRDVPLHPELIEIGFLAFVESVQDGSLFFASNTGRKGVAHPSKTVAGRLSQWIRSLGIIPPEVDPNHGWRHRFKTIGREVGMDPRVMDAIQGHAARTAGDQYGDVTIKARMAAIEKIPKFETNLT
jgi:integrase